MKNIFNEGWELRCEAQFQSHSQDGFKAYICSPLRADTLEGVRKNMLAAKAYMLYALETLGIYAYAPHAFLPVFLCDEHPNERKLALQIGKFALALSNLLYVCGDRITEGMKGEIVYAAKLGKSIHVFNENVYALVKEIVDGEGRDPETVQLLLGYAPLGSSCPVTEFMRIWLRLAQAAKEQRYGVSV